MEYNTDFLIHVVPQLPEQFSDERITLQHLVFKAYYVTLYSQIHFLNLCFIMKVPEQPS